MQLHFSCIRLFSPDILSYDMEYINFRFIFYNIRPDSADAVRAEHLKQVDIPPGQWYHFLI